MSAKTGTAPTWSTAWAVAMNESAGTTTSWPGPPPRRQGDAGGGGAAIRRQAEPRAHEGGELRLERPHLGGPRPREHPPGEHAQDGVAVGRAQDGAAPG